jgi:hypothetical protein
LQLFCIYSSRLVLVVPNQVILSCLFLIPTFGRPLSWIDAQISQI